MNRIVCVFVSLIALALFSCGNSIEGTIVNATTGEMDSVEELTLIAPGAQGMLELGRIENAGPEFSFSVDEFPQGPMLLRARKGDATYVTVIPPVPEFREREQRVTVYETGAPEDSLRVTRALQVTRFENHLEITQYHAIENQSHPPRSFSGADYSVFLPGAAEQVRAQLRFLETNMPVPVQLQSDSIASVDRLVTLDRAIRPGSSELTVTYRLPTLSFVDEALPIGGGEHNFRILIWAPRQGAPRISGATAVPAGIPDYEGPAYRVMYRGERVLYNFQSVPSAESVMRESHQNQQATTAEEDGLPAPDLSVFQPSPAARAGMQSRLGLKAYNPVLVEPTVTIAALLAVLLLFFIVIGLVRATGLRFTKGAAD